MMLSQLSAQDRPPNIIHILADDVGYDDIGCFGSKDISTPHLDAMAKEGMKFTSFYAPHSTCTPSRAALMTGCYAPRVGLPNVLFPNSKIGLSELEITIASLLKSRGYATACIGKWHLGHLPQFLPTRHGFDLFLGIPYPNDHVPDRLDAQGKSRGFPPIPLYRQDEVIQQPAQLATLPERFTAEAIQFITVNKNRPFFLHLANIETHTPWLVSQPFQYKSKAGVFGDAVQCLDNTVGQVLKTIKQLGLERDTLIICTSDNGPLVHRYPELEGIYGHTATVDPQRQHLLREGKYQSRYEGGTRVFCIARWPGRIPVGQTCDELVAGFDFYPTFARLAGAEIPKDRVIDGKDIWPLMKGEPDARSPHEAFFYYEGYRLVAVRSGKWKLVLADKNAPQKGKPRPAELYNLENDPGEKSNVINYNSQEAARLEAHAEKMRKELGDANHQMKGTSRREPGK